MKKGYKSLFVILLILIGYIALRVAVLKYTSILEDTDSVGKLFAAKAYYALDFDKIWNLPPTQKPFYPMMAALFSIPGWSIEMGARLCSLFFSVILLLSLAGIGKKMGDLREVSIGLLIIAFSPILLTLSIAVLTEPTYIGTVYLGLCLYWSQYDDPKLWKGALLGIVFGLTFLTRIEGILFIVFIPILQGIHILITKANKYSLKYFIKWAMLYFAFFAAVSIPHIWNLSAKMGGFGIDGRQVWSIVLNTPDGKSYLEKIYGLDFDPGAININYLMSHHESIGKYTHNVSSTQYIKKYIKRFLVELDTLSRNRTGKLVGSFGMIFFAFGLVALFSRGKHFDILLILLFIGTSLIPSLLHTVDIRHIAVIGPAMMMLEGFGIVFISRKVLEQYQGMVMIKSILPFLLLFFLISTFTIPLQNTFNPPSYNKEYSQETLREPIQIIKTISKNDLHRIPIISSRKQYITYFSGGHPAYLPFTDYKGLVKYCKINQVDFLYLHYRLIKKFPFINQFKNSGGTPYFKKLFSGKDPYGENNELYRFTINQEIGSHV